MFIDYLGYVALNRVDGLQLGIDVVVKPKQVVHIGEGKVTTDVSAVELGQLQGPVLHQTQGIGAPDAQFGVGSHLYVQPAVGPHRDPFDLLLRQPEGVCGAGYPGQLEIVGLTVIGG